MITTNDIKDKARSWYLSDNVLEREIARTYFSLARDYKDIQDMFMRGKFDDDTQEKLAEAVANTNSQLIVVRGIIRRTILREKGE